MTTRIKATGHLFLIFLEVVLITFLNYKVAGYFYSLDVLYCLPVIQAAHLGAIRAQRKSDTSMPVIIGIFAGISWSFAEAVLLWSQYPVSALMVNIITRSLTFTILGRVMVKLWKEKAYSRIDPLTGLANRVELLERFGSEQSRSERSDKPYSLLFIDIDHFKQLNDSQGHATGDIALKAVANILRKNSRSLDTMCRYGGDEFVALFPETDEAICGILIDRIRAAAEDEFRSCGWAISLSIGSATKIGSEKSFEEVLRLADESMYLNKSRLAESC